MNQHTLMRNIVPMPIDFEFPVLLDDFQGGFRQLAAGVCIVTTRHNDEDLGIAVTSVTSLSSDPPSLLVCVNQKSSIHDRLLDAKRFCVNVLSTDHQTISASFGNPTLKHKRFVDGHWVDRGLPVLADALASFECSVVEAPVFGTHSIIVGQIDWIEAQGEECDPLLYFRGSYRSLPQDRDD